MIIQEADNIYRPRVGVLVGGVQLWAYVDLPFRALAEKFSFGCGTSFSSGAAKNVLAIDPIRVLYNHTAEALKPKGTPLIMTN
jgi:hypothetical protein